ncbi:MAG: hypothetical protein ACOVO1_02035 [Chitinophagaceae bacterium]
MASINKKIDEITFAHFKEVRAICNAQHKKKFDEIIVKALKMQARKGSRHRPPPMEEGRPPREEMENDGPK